MSFAGMWRRYRCCPLDQPDIPASPSNLMIFDVSGYFYRTIPEWFDETGQRMMATQFSVEPEYLGYSWTFYKTKGDLCDRFFHLSTSEDVVPVIYERKTGRRMKVIRMAKHNGYTTWRISC